jgi:hypothetical protein
MSDRVVRLADGHIVSIEINTHKLRPDELEW